ncbi:MAG: TIGR02281 family clan AA aspartic protease [Parvularculaceae bacterium]
MRAETFLAIAVVAGTALAVRIWERTNDHPAAVEAVAAYAPGAYEAREANTHGHRNREVRIAAAHDHQFYVVAGVNRRSAEFLVDTGASFVALRDTDARAAGVFTIPADYTVPIRTANGETKAALVTLDEVEIDGIVVRGVKAFVLPDEQLSVNLLGMSFLSRLESVEARAGELVLRG